MIKKSILAISLVSLLVSGCTIQLGKKQPPAIRGVFKSVDAAATWTPKSLYLHSQGVGSIAGIDVLDITFDSNDANTIYLTTVNGGLVYTLDAGESWQKPLGVPLTRVEAVAIDPTNKCVVYIAIANTIRKTVDCTRTWREVYVDTRADKLITTLTIDRTEPSRIYASNTAGDILRSNNGGTEWQVVQRLTDRITKFLFDPFDTRVFYVATARKGIYRTTDSGLTWVNLSDGLRQFRGALEYRNLLIDSSKSNSLLLVSKYGLLRTSDGGLTWEAVNLITPPGATEILAAAINTANDRNELYYATAATFYASSDGGQTWETRRLPSAARPSVLVIHPQNPDVMYMGLVAPPQ